MLKPRAFRVRPNRSPRASLHAGGASERCSKASAEWSPSWWSQATSRESERVSAPAGPEGGHEPPRSKLLLVRGVPEGRASWPCALEGRQGRRARVQRAGPSGRMLLREARGPSTVLARRHLPRLLLLDEGSGRRRFLRECEIGDVRARSSLFGAPRGRRRRRDGDAGAVPRRARSSRTLRAASRDEGPSGAGAASVASRKARMRMARFSAGESCSESPRPREAPRAPKRTGTPPSPSRMARDGDETSR